MGFRKVDAMMLDEEFGKLGWTNSYHRDEKGILVCTIGVYDEKGRLVERSNSGIESQQTDDNKYKAEYSDAMKRCGFLWGIGSELYTSPFIWVSKEKYRTRTVQGRSSEIQSTRARQDEDQRSSPERRRDRRSWARI